MIDHFEASCLCRGITLRYSGPIGPANYCHCEDCRRVTGSAFNIGVRVERKHLQVQTKSELKAYKYTGGNGQPIERYFCSQCGSPIFTLHPTRPDYAWVKAGIINNPEVVVPTHENWIKDKVKWSTVNVPESFQENRPA